MMGKARLLLLLAPLALLPATTTATPMSMFVVGDSISDTGNFFLATSQPPLNAIPLAPLPQAANYFGRRFSNGPVWVDYLNGYLGNAGPLLPSFAGGTNFAVGGARSRYHAVDSTLNPAFSPFQDVSAALFPQFTLLGQSQLLTAGGPLDGSALYTIYGGSNDVGDAIDLELATGMPSRADALVAQAAGDTITAIQTIVAAGATKLLVPNVGDLGLVPEYLGNARATELSQAFNALIDDALSMLAVQVIRLDVFQLVTDLAADPTQFGLPATFDVTNPCFSGFVGQDGTECDDADNRAFWDVIHPSAVTHRLLGQAAIAAVPEPATVALAALGLAAVARVRRRGRSA